MDHGQNSKSAGAGAGLPTISTLPPPRLKPSIPSAIEIPSFSTFQAQTPRVNILSPVRRKPLPPSAASATSRPPPLPLDTGGLVVAVGEEASNEQEHPPHRVWLPTPSSASPPLVARDLDQFPRGQSPLVTKAPRGAHFPPSSASQRQSLCSSTTRLSHVRLASDPILHDSFKSKTPTDSGSPQRAMSLHPGNRPSNLHINSDQRSFSNNETNDITRTPRSPGPNKLTSFFGWKTSSPVAEISPTTYSTGSQSQAPSPLSPSPHSITSSNKSIPQAIDVPRANAQANAQATTFADIGFPLPPQNSVMSTQVADMEEELREVSSELAGSIRREMELEDLVDRLQLEATQGPDLGRRTSDYFSDSGTSSVRYPPSDVGGGKMEDLAKLKRLSEQEKARFKLDLSQKLQDERGRRKALELHIQQLGEQVQHVDQERAAASSTSNRVRDLENSLEDSRRRLNEERRIKENFEDLLTALRGEIEQHRDERDNLRDEVVPQLRARVEGLEGEALEYQKLTYENARMQQELQSLKNENTTLMNARRLQLEMQQHASRFNSIAEEDAASPIQSSTKIGLTRSSSVARRSVVGGFSRTGSLSRPNSISAKDRESRESLADRVKDIEMQRDALHRALKSLLDRQTFQNKEHQKKTHALEIERDLALQTQFPRRTGFEKEVTGLQFEINQLRRRADEALVQKWQCEKGLGGLKMDLDRAEQETSSLRNLLQENDILIPDLPTRASQEVEAGAQVTSASLEKAYKELRATQALSITKLRELHGQAPSSGEDADTAQTMDLLLKSMSDAEAERDYAQKQAEVYRAKAESLQDADSFHTGENAGLVEQLRASANRVEALATQVRLQLASNSGLRERLAEAVGRGEREQKASTTRINDMQGKLKSLEDKLMSAQQHSEEAFAQHEEEVQEIKDSHNSQLQRLKGGLRTPTLYSPKTPLSPMFIKSPRLDKTTSGVGMSMNEALRTEVLEKKVVELEKALGDADKEMEEVVSKMNLAQIEVMELQTARDDAMRQTRKLQAAINAEREKVDSLMR